MLHTLENLYFITNTKLYITLNMNDKINIIYNIYEETMKINY